MVAQEAFICAIKTVLLVYDKEFWKLQEAHKLQSGEYLRESVDIFQYYPLYNGRRQQEHRNSDHEVHNAKEMIAFWNCTKYVLNCGEHGQIFF